MKFHQEEGNDSIRGSITPLNAMDEALEAKEMQYKVEGINGRSKRCLLRKKSSRLVVKIGLGATPVLQFNFNSKSKMRRIETHKPAQIDA